VLANFLEVNQILAVELMQLKKISIAHGFAFYTQAFALHAQAFAVDARALALYLPQSFQVFSTPSK
jgi:hypothetical protein